MAEFITLLTILWLLSVWMFTVLVQLWVYQVQALHLMHLCTFRVCRVPAPNQVPDCSLKSHKKHLKMYPQRFWLNSSGVFKCLLIPWISWKKFSRRKLRLSTQMWSFKAQREIQVLQARNLSVTAASTAHFGRMLDTDLAGLAELGLEPVWFFCGPRPRLLGKGALTPPQSRVPTPPLSYLCLWAFCAKAVRLCLSLSGTLVSIVSLHPSAALLYIHSWSSASFTV